VLSGNSAFLAGGGAYSGTLNNCTLSSNSASGGGGAADATLNNCVVISNSAYSGGGASRSVLIACTLVGNSASSEGGGILGGALMDCVLTNNSAPNGGACAYGVLNRCVLANNSGAFGGGAFNAFLDNCLLTGNLASSGGGATGSQLNNCTVFGNSASQIAGGIWSAQHPPLGIPIACCDGHGCCPFNSTANNCVVYSNTAPVGANFNADTYLNYSCTTPLPVHGFGNITNAPLFVDPAAGDFRLQSNSPCINAGRNAYAPLGSDLAGNPRIIGGTIDVGVYEFQSPQSSISYAWLQQYSLPIDGSADFTDPDGDGHNNSQEWRARTDPTNSGSALRLLTPLVSTNGLLVRWQSVNDRMYSLERGTNLAAQGSFQTVASNIVGQASTTDFTDTNVHPMSARWVFYRVGVNE
jgi:hypothetical protein